MTQQIEKVMVFKEFHQLPAYLKHIPEYVPQPLERVVVLEEIPNTITGKINFLRIRFGGTNKGVLSVRYFRTLNQEKLRQRLLQQPATKKIEQLLAVL